MRTANLRRAHLDRSAQCGLARRHGVRPLTSSTWRLSYSADVNDHVVLEVVVRCNYADAILVLEADAVVIETVEVLDSRDDGVRTVVRGDHDSHGQTSLYARVFRVDQLEDDMLLVLLHGRRAVAAGAAGRAIAGSCRAVHVHAIGIAIAIHVLSITNVAGWVLVALPSVCHVGASPLTGSKHVVELHFECTLVLLLL